MKSCLASVPAKRHYGSLRRPALDLTCRGYVYLRRSAIHTCLPKADSIPQINKDGKGYPIRLYVQPKGGESKKKHTATKSLSTKAVLAQIHTVDGTSPSDIRRALVESAEAEATLVKVGELDLPEEEEEAAEDKKGKKKKQSKGTNKPRKL